MNLYRRGYRAELKLVKLLKQQDEFHTVIRSAGSRSPFDIVAVGENQILLCQVKTGKGGFKQEQGQLRQLSLPDCARVEVWLYRRGKWEIIKIR